MVKIPEGLHKRQVVADFFEVFLDEYLIADSLAPGAFISCDPGGLWLRARRLAPQLLFDPPEAEDAEMDAKEVNIQERVTQDHIGCPSRLRLRWVERSVPKIWALRINLR